VILTSILPSIVVSMNQDVVSEKEMEAVNFIKEKTSRLSTIAASPKEGHLVNFAGRRNVMDTYYLGVKDTNERFEDLNTLYTTEINSIAKQIIEKYGVDYIFLTKHGKKFYNLDKLNYKDKCFKEVFKNEDAEIYSTEC
jgi:uncharacterized membrane protein